MKGILGKKLGMARIVKDNGYVPVTVIECQPNTIAQLKTTETDGYNAVVLGFDPIKRPTKTKKFYFSKEFKVDSLSDLEKGKTVDVSIFSEGDAVSLTGTSKGKGFQGVVRRFHFAGGPASHGSHFKREPGSVGARAKPGKIHLGKKLPGRMGGETVTIRNTQIEFVDTTKNLIGIRGPVPGSINSYVQITKLN